MAAPPTMAATTTVVSPAATPVPVQTTTAAPTSRIGEVIVTIRLEFNISKEVPSKEEVMKIANDLYLYRFRTMRALSLDYTEINYEKISDNAFAIIMLFHTSNVIIDDSIQFNNETYTEIDEAVNDLLKTMLSNSQAPPFHLPLNSFNVTSNIIYASVVYKFKDGDIANPSTFLSALLEVSDKGSLTLISTTPPSPVLLPVVTPTPGSRDPGIWGVAIAVPIGVALILLPCWIALCCVLCGCCAGLRRRWQRRRSYPVQYTTRNGLF
ncbi:uncharacterized protein LOC136752667 [Amia ocellicauda]|uniref:uncharacterized protein LOC136752667 n=1 Tax=Amia ocellicauda TaxID=2972642 RepID=UPI0034640128